MKKTKNFLDEVKSMNIIICCASGLSSSIIAQKMRVEIRSRNLDYKVASINLDDLEGYLNTVDIILVAPQIASQLQFIEKSVEDKGILVSLISRSDYVNFDGVKLVEQIQFLRGQSLPVENRDNNYNEKSLFKRSYVFFRNCLIQIVMILAFSTLIYVIRNLIHLKIIDLIFFPLELIIINSFTIYVTVILGYNFGKELKIRSDISLVLGFLVYTCLLPINFINDYSILIMGKITYIDLKYFGFEYSFLAIFISFLALTLYRFLENRLLGKWKEILPKMFEPVIPLLIIFTMILLIRNLIY